MIYIGNIWTIKLDEDDEIWVICRSIGELSDMFSTHRSTIYVSELFHQRSCLSIIELI